MGLKVKNPRFPMSSQKCFTPKTSILTFLRRDVLKAETKLLEQKGTSIFDTSATLSQAKRAFYTKRATAVAHKQFKELKSNMQTLFNNGEIGTTLGTQHHRMLLEDIMGLSVGTEIVYLIHLSYISLMFLLLGRNQLGGLDGYIQSLRIRSRVVILSNFKTIFIGLSRRLYAIIQRKITSIKGYIQRMIYLKDVPKRVAGESQ